MSLPKHLRKPKHRLPVVASANGWEVAETGELLVRVKDLDKKLAEYFGVAAVEPVVEVAEDVADAQEDAEIDAIVEQIEAAQAEVEEVVEAPKRRGRPPKAKA